MYFILIALAAPAVSAMPAKPVAKKEVCRRQAETGSFAKVRKVCRSKQEWNRLSQGQRDEAYDYSDHGRGGSRGE